MTSRRRKQLTWASSIVIAMSLILSLGGRLLPNRAIRIGGSSTTEYQLIISTGSIGIVRIEDPTGYAIPYFSRAEKVVDIQTWQQTDTRQIRLLWFSCSVHVDNWQGNPVTLRTRFLSYLSVTALALIFLLSQGAILTWARAVMLVKQWRIKRHVRHQLAFGESCPKCGYDVRMSDNTCPECGQAFVRSTVIVSVPSEKL